MLRSLLVLGAALSMAGCWTSHGSVRYADFNAFRNIDAPGAEVLGKVTGSGHVSYAGVCNAAAEDALEEAMIAAGNLGANALTDVRWEDDGKYYDRPVCGAGFAFYWWGGSADVTATAVKLPEAELARLKGAVPVPAAVTTVEERPPAEVAPAEVARLTPPRTTQEGSQDYAVIIGIERYQGELPVATHAKADAMAFADYARTTLGIPLQHIKILTGARAGKAAIESAIQEWLPRNVRDARSRVYVFFSGHGAPDPKTGDAYLVPWDADPAYLKTRGVSIKELYGQLEGLPARRLYVFLDACFSGSGGRSVLAKGTRPLVPVQTATANRLIALTASGARETTGAARDMAHGLFTRHLLAGLGGAADANADKRVTIGELTDFVTQKVSRDARLDNREQTPHLVSKSRKARSLPLVSGLP